MQEPLHVRVLVDVHMGSVGGIAAHADGGGMVTCGADGTLRLWGLKQDLKSGQGGAGGGGGVTSVLLARRAFSSAQTCLAVAPVTVNKEMALAGVSWRVGVGEAIAAGLVFCLGW